MLLQDNWCFEEKTHYPPHDTKKKWTNILVDIKKRNSRNASIRMHRMRNVAPSYRPSGSSKSNSCSWQMPWMAASNWGAFRTSRRSTQTSPVGCGGPKRGENSENSRGGHCFLFLSLWTCLLSNWFSPYRIWGTLCRTGQTAGFWGWWPFVPICILSASEAVLLHTTHCKQPP